MINLDIFACASDNMRNILFSKRAKATPTGNPTVPCQTSNRYLHCKTLKKLARSRVAASGYFWVNEIVFGGIVMSLYANLRPVLCICRTLVAGAITIGVWPCASSPEAMLWRPISTPPTAGKKVEVGSAITSLSRCMGFHGRDSITNDVQNTCAKTHLG